MAHSAVTTAVAVTGVASKGIRAVCSGEGGFGGSSIKQFSVNLSDKYFAGTGEDLNTALVGPGKLFENGVLMVVLQPLDTTAVYHIRMDPDTRRVFLYDEHDTSGIMAELAENTDVTAIVIEGYAIGY